MKTMIFFSRSTLLLMWLFLSFTCAPQTNTSKIVLVGSTPGDETIKSMLSIPGATTIDFIKWNLKLDSKRTFVLEITYGESQPNTLGFKRGSEKRTINGTFSVVKNDENSHFREIYHLKSGNLTKIISLVKLNQNLFHLLSPQDKLMIGNGGYSYSLNREDPASPGEILISSTISEEKTLQVVFDGRTPCQEIAAEHAEIGASESCFKLKWRLILNRDSIQYSPTTCTIRKIIDNEPHEVNGKWTIIKGTHTNPNVVIYKIDTGRADESISFLVGDDNILFFLDKNNMPYIGNKDFSYTLNRRIQNE